MKISRSPRVTDRRGVARSDATGLNREGALDAVSDGTGDGVLFWYGAPHVAVALNSRRYRIDNRLERLPMARSFTGRTLPDEVLEGIHTVVSVRAYVDPKAAGQLARLRARGLHLIADYDDLLFACPPRDFPGYHQTLLKRRVVKKLDTYRSGLTHFDAFTASTTPIAEALRAARPDAPVATIPNRPSPAWFARGWSRFGDDRWQHGGPLVLRYLPGSPSHDHDFAVIADPMAEFLRRHDDVNFEVVGYLRFDSTHFPKGRVRHLAKVDYEAFAGVLVSTWINLVPLAPTVYSQARSALKILEAAGFGVPSIASPSVDNASVGGPSSLVTFARTPTEWLDALEAAYDETRSASAPVRAPFQAPPSWDVVERRGDTPRWETSNSPWRG